MPSALLFNARANVLRAARGKDASGGHRLNWAAPEVLHANVPVRVQASPPGELRVFGGRQEEVSHRVYTPRDVTDVRLDDKVAVVDGPQHLMVLGARDEGGAGRVFTVYCRQVVQPPAAG